MEREKNRDEGHKEKAKQTNKKKDSKQWKRTETSAKGRKQKQEKQTQAAKKQRTWKNRRKEKKLIQWSQFRKKGLSSSLFLSDSFCLISWIDSLLPFTKMSSKKQPRTSARSTRFLSSLLLIVLLWFLFLLNAADDLRLFRSVWFCFCGHVSRDYTKSAHVCWINKKKLALSKFLPSFEQHITHGLKNALMKLIWHGYCNIYHYVLAVWFGWIFQTII